MQLNETHNPALQSWLASANADTSDFPIQNLPFAVFRTKGSNEPFRGGVAIGDEIVDMQKLAPLALFDETANRGIQAAAQSTLNAFMEMGQETWSAVRSALSQALAANSPLQAQIATCLVSQSDAEYTVPCTIGDYTDFYTSVHHATNIGKLFRPDNPLLPNYKWVPIGYHGRASSIAVSGQSFPRPYGQLKAPDADTPSVAPAKRMDYELELGIFIGKGNALGSPIAMSEAENHVFGCCLLNDWSARDIQAWEYQPLGPFLSKSFASTISPWIVTMEALAPYRQPFTRSAEDPQPLPYLSSALNDQAGHIDIQFDVLISTEQSRADGTGAMLLSRSNYKDAYWTIAQMVTHHSINGCNLQAGDLLGSGTQSGPTPDQAGALIELTQGGKNPITLANGETRQFLHDGDTIIMKAQCRSDHAVRIGFGECSGTLLPAKSL